ncbi:MAG: DUF2177 family protein, partial [Burkholderiales bacterium]
MQWLLAWGAAFVALAVLDGAWLGWLARDFYKRELGALMAEKIRYAAAALFYLAYPVAIVYF